jgi:hypothetical protein
VSPTATSGAIEARFNHVYTRNASAPGCHEIVNDGPAVEWMNVAADPPAPAGGALAPGTYHLTRASFYTGPGGASGPGGFHLHETKPKV